MKKIFYANDINYFYLNEIELETLPDDFKLPNNATFEIPPSEIPKGKKAKLNKEKKWELVNDEELKKVYNIETGEEYYVSIYEKLPNNLSEKHPSELEELELDQSTNKYKKNINILKQKKLNDLKYKHLNYLSNYKSTVIVDNDEWDSGEIYKKNIDLALKEIKKGKVNAQTLTWLNFENIPKELTAEQLQKIHDDIETDLFIKGQESYQKKWEYRTLIENESDYAILENMEFVFGA